MGGCISYGRPGSVQVRKIAEDSQFRKSRIELLLPEIGHGNGASFSVKLFALTVIVAVSLLASTTFELNSPGTLRAGEASIVNNIVYFPLFFHPSIEVPGPLYGVNFISSAEDPADELQYANGSSTGASFNRWPIYWFNVEKNQGNYDWQAQDRVILDDMAHGFQTNAILLGTPSFYRSDSGAVNGLTRPSQRGMFSMQAVQAATPAGLYEPVFSDGTDIPSPGKGINDNNVWAKFVYLAVNRYKPAGELASLHHLADDSGVTHWEIWNEPDLEWFWDGSLADYARLLKVGYIAAKQADPMANVLFGALANNVNHLSYYEEVLQIFASDSQALAQNYFHDILATHSYFYAWQSWYHVYRAAGVMNDFGLDKPIWLNETGVPAWDEYPGPIWDPISKLRATTAEQAHYTIQTAFYALFAGADAMFHFQLYDGCGNQPRGTDFPPHDGELCGNPAYPICAGDANGLFSNPNDAACFRQHPQPESPRANFDAFKLLTTFLTEVEPYWRLRPGGSDPYNGPQEWIAFYRPTSGVRVVGLWSRDGGDHIAHLEATGSSALMILPDGTTQKISPVYGYYELVLPGATNQNAPWDPDLYAIGGRPTIIVEQDTKKQMPKLK